MSSTQGHPSERRKSADPRAEARAISHAASLHDPHSDQPQNLDEHGFTRHGHRSRKGRQVIMIVLSVGAVCAFGFGLLAELLG